MDNSTKDSRAETGLIRIAILALILTLATSAHAYRGEATDAAFAALFSMPGGGPTTGYWKFDIPADFEAKNEEELIAYLAKKRKEGADFNAYRHKGTLLHHAIRVGFEKTALWLLKNGADPSLGGPHWDALSLSEKYHREKITEALTGSKSSPAPAKKTPPKNEPAKPPAPPAEEPVTGSTIWDALKKGEFEEYLGRHSPQKIEAALADVREPRWLLSNLLVGTSDTDEKPDQFRAKSHSRWQLLAQAMSLAAYWKVVDDEVTFANLVRLNKYDTDHFAGMLDSLPAEVLERHQGTTLAVLVESSERPPMGVWRLVWKRFKRPLDYPALPNLAEKLQPELWPELYASDYDNRDAESALGCLLAESSAADLERYWPALKAQFPAIDQVVPKLVLLRYRLGAPCGYDMRRGETLQKLAFLRQQGVTSKARGIWEEAFKEESPELQQAVRPFLPEKGEIPQPRLVETLPDCEFALNESLYRELLNPIVTSGERFEWVKIETVQLVQIPGERQCGLVVGGYERVEEIIFGAEDEFEGPSAGTVRPSCPHPTNRYEVWRNNNGKVEKLRTELGESNKPPGLFLVKDTKGSGHYYLGETLIYGGCGPRPDIPDIFIWKKTTGAWRLSRHEDKALFNALYDQCRDTDKGIFCGGVPGIELAWAHVPKPDQESPEEKQMKPFRVMALNGFILAYRQGLHDDYLAAVMALDKPRLKELQAQGIPAAWTSEAINAVSASSLSLEEKRRRTAWLFYDHAQLAKSLDSSVLGQLVKWLPREDWGPIFKVLEPQGGRPLKYLRDDVAEMGLNDLVCDFDHALGLICGETWGAGEPPAE